MNRPPSAENPSPREASSPEISVVIATLHREEPLRQTLQYFLDREAHPSFEVIVIDQSDAHEPETRKFLDENAGRFRLVRVAYHNLARARNDGVRLARGRIIAFVDDDVDLMEGHLGRVAAAQARPGVVAVTGPTVPLSQKLLDTEDLDEKTRRQVLRGFQCRSDVSFPHHAQFAPGCNMSFQDRVIRELGGFDENFHGFSSMEDAEFSHRLKQAGYVIHYCPEVRLFHKSAPSGGCRDAMGCRATLRALIENTDYFHGAVGAGAATRLFRTLRLFRHHVAHHTRGHPLRFVADALFFLGSLFRARARSRRLLASASRTMSAHVERATLVKQTPVRANKPCS